MRYELQRFNVEVHGEAVHPNLLIVINRTRPSSQMKQLAYQCRDTPCGYSDLEIAVMGTRKGCPYKTAIGIHDVYFFS